jgi:NADPH-dependent 2,4-dienoyl-CoA reductase/sulfur reductase-like enzyme
MHVAIIGNGVAGVSAALRLREQRPDWRITLVSGESTHHWSRPALMYVFMGHMRYHDTKPFPDEHWARQRIDLLRAWVTRVDLERRRLELHDQSPLHWDRLLIATGSKPNRFGWPGQDLDGVQGLWGLLDLQRLVETLPRVRRAVLVGGGLIGVELAEMLHSRGVPVTFLVREASYWDNVLPPEESRLVTEVIREQGVDLRLETELAEIQDDGHGRVAGVRTGDGAAIPCELVGLTAGVSPNIDLVKDTAIVCRRGIVVDSALRTSEPDVFAAGDCAELHLEGDEPPRLEQVWYTGKRQGELVADVIAGEERRYEPGLWFNSAKFFDLEYQTYGRVNRRVPGEASLYWQHPDRRLALRIVHVDGRVIGFNLMGLRWRHAVAERWLAEAVPVEALLPRLREASFDPELFARHEPAIAAAFHASLEGSPA